MDDGFPLPDLSFDDFSMIPIDEPIPNSSPKTLRPDNIEIMTYFGFIPCSSEPFKCTSNSYVYQAKSEADGQIYALKLTSNKSRISREFENRKRLPSSLYLVECYDIYDRDRFIVLQMEYCSSGDLFGHQYTENLIWLLIHDISAALYIVHYHGFIHLDVSPSNILINNTYFKLGDFGTLIEFGQFQSGCEGAGPYASSEALHFPGNATSGFFDVGPPSDIFSFGVVLLEVASGFYAPRGCDKRYELLRSGEIKLGDEMYQCNMSADLINIVNNMLNPNPHLRPTALQLMQHPRVVQAGQNR